VETTRSATVKVRPMEGKYNHNRVRDLPDTRKEMACGDKSRWQRRQLLSR
jgi:hypothetical protein